MAQRRAIISRNQVLKKRKQVERVRARRRVEYCNEKSVAKAQFRRRASAVPN